MEEFTKLIEMLNRTAPEVYQAYLKQTTFVFWNNLFWVIVLAAVSSWLVHKVKTDLRTRDLDSLHFGWSIACLFFIVMSAIGIPTLIWEAATVLYNPQYWIYTQLLGK